jgi:hypothetical protein
MIDLCKIFGVEEGEEFRLSKSNNNYRIYNNKLHYYDDYYDRWEKSHLDFNVVANMEVIKLPKKKEFTDDELCILRNIDKESKWIARDESNNLYIYKNKPTKINRYWDVEYGERQRLKVFSHLFQSIQWEDDEPVFIDDYVERGGE